MNVDGSLPELAELLITLLQVLNNVPSELKELTASGATGVGEWVLLPASTCEGSFFYALIFSYLRFGEIC